MAVSPDAEKSLPDPDLNLLSPLFTQYRGQGESALLPALQETQEIYGYLPRLALEALSRALPVALSRIYGVITFYDEFRLSPRGRNLIKCCQGTTCQMKGGETLLDAVKRHLGIKEGETTSDGRFTLETSACPGRCDLAPSIMVNDDFFDQITPDQVEALLKRFK